MNLRSRIDEYFRNHPWQMLLAVVLFTALVAVPAVVYNIQGAIVLYQAF